MPKSKKEKALKPEKKKLEVRQPIVAVMGHVDHGKTSFLDAIRGTRVTAKEAGGITQNTRAHEVTTKTGFKITFIDTPGHEAFSNMRKRGAKVTDFVLLMVAADDGIQPQTKESITFAKENNVPIIVAINKIDIEGVKTLKIKQELASFGVNIEEYGGESMCFEISATKNIGLEELLDGIELLSEVNELKPNAVREGTEGEAFVLESSLDKHIGYSALALLKSGNLNDRFFGVSKEGYFKVRAYLDENGKPLNSVNESAPFVVTGLKNDLVTGDSIYFVKSEDEAKKLELKIKDEEVSMEEEIEEVPEVSNEEDIENLFAQMLVKREEVKRGVEQKLLNVVLKTSSQGTLEAALQQIEELATDESRVNVLSSGTGPVNEDDLNRAKLSRGIVLSFQVDIPRPMEDLAKRNKVILRHYEVIYAMIDELADVLDSLDTPQEEEVEIAVAKVKQVFILSDKSTVAGCAIEKGVFIKGYRVKIMRGEEELGRTKVKTLRQNKNEVKEVKKGSDCGMQFEPEIKGIEEGDMIVAFKMERV